jgi:microcystin-dependent protein
MPLKNGRTSAALQQILVGSIIPPGTIQAFGGGTVPSGWLLCDGSTANRSTYSALFSAIGVAHGSGDGSTTFHLPDLRGRFLRGADNMGTGAAGRDPDAATRTAANAGGNTGNAVGSVQSDAMQGHEHSYLSYSANFGISNNYADASGTGLVQSNNTASDGTFATKILGPITDGTNGTPRTSGESRPQNLAVEYIIKV